MENTKYDDGSRKKERQGAFIGTIAFFGILLVACLFLGLVTPLPIPDEIGGMVMLGETEYGNNYNAPVPVRDVEPQVPKPQPKPSEPVEASDDVVTNDAEDAPVVTENKPKTTQQDPQETNTDVEETPEDVTEPVEEPRKSNPLFEFEKSDNESPGKGSGDDHGNQGSENGSINGTGSGSSGVSYDMRGRGLVKGPPAITGDNQRLEKIVLEITVNKEGEVIRAVPTIKGGGTLTTGSLVEEAKAAVLKMRFTSNPDAFDEQTGTVTFRIKPK